jgi:hypothetical protein
LPLLLFLCFCQQVSGIVQVCRVFIGNGNSPFSFFSCIVHSKTGPNPSPSPSPSDLGHSLRGRSPCGMCRAPRRCWLLVAVAVAVRAALAACSD